MKLILKELMNQGIHFGHNKYDTKMSMYLLGFKGKRSIINLEQTLINLSRITKLIKDIIKERGNLLIVSKNSFFSKQIKYIFSKVNQPYISLRWIGGNLTNFDQIKKSIYKIKKGKLKHRSVYQGISGLKDKPTLCFILNTNENRTSIKESNISKIPTIGVIDSDSNPNRITYVIPGNDDSIESLTLYTNILQNAIKIGNVKKIINFYK